MKKIIFIFTVILIGISALLIAFSPNRLSIFILGVMIVLIALGMLFGVIPTLMYADGFRKGIKNIEKALSVPANNNWLAVVSNGQLFQHATLDALFQEYCEKVQNQRENKQIISDIEDYINDTILSFKSWQGVLAQIPGSLTGLGILGTFIGLIMGISDLSITSVEATVESVQLLLNGIEVAFYTSISGVVLSIIYNLFNKMAWNIMNQEMGIFFIQFHKQVIPTVEEQSRYRERRDFQLILDRLDRIPKKDFSLSGGFAQEQGDSSEKILMPQIISGIKQGEFTFYLQPRMNMISGQLVGAEALSRWNHPKLGLVSPATYIPVLENNGYITKFDQYIWEEIVKKIREWIDKGYHVTPVSINITKTDILALNITEIFDGLIQKYKIPPRYLDIDLPMNASLDMREEVSNLADSLRSKGFRIVIDGFEGDFIQLETDENRIQADALKLDLRHLDNNQDISYIFDQGKKLRYNMIVEGIENMEQVKLLRKHGCVEGQGYYFSKPLSLDDFTKKYYGA